MDTKFKKLAFAGAITGMISLSGCGGGGGGTTATPVGTTLSGTVAGGAAVIGTVIVTDSKGATKETNIEADGHYVVDVNGMTGPFVLKAAGTVGNSSVTYYSAALAADVGHTISITPFTNLMVSNIAAQLAETYFSDPANIAKIGTTITATNLAAAQTEMHAKLLPVLNALGIDAGIDLLRTSFATDHSGLDAAMDLVKVEVDPVTNIATLKNAITQATLGTDDLKTTDSTPIASTGITTTAVTTLQAVVTKLNGFAALFATSLPSQAQMEASGVFDTTSTFMMDGKSFAQFATEMSTDSTAIGMTFSNVAVTLDSTGNAGTLTFLITFKGGAPAQMQELAMVKATDGSWKITGDGHIAEAHLEAQAQLNQWKSYNTSGTLTGSGSDMQNGLHIQLDPFAYNSDSSHTPVASALVTGPGLGTAGITMVPSTHNTWFMVQGMSDGDNQVRECGSSAPNGGSPLTTQCITIAQAVDNSQYTVVLKDSSGNSLNGAGYTLTLAKQPYATSVLTAATATYFPTLGPVTIGGVEVTSLAQLVPSASLVFNWTMPTGIAAKDLQVWANMTTGDSFFGVNKDLAATDTSKMIGLPATLPTGTANSWGVWLNGEDVYGRRLAINKSVSVN